MKQKARGSFVVVRRGAPGSRQNRRSGKASHSELFPNGAFLPCGPAAQKPTEPPLQPIGFAVPFARLRSKPRPDDAGPVPRKPFLSGFSRIPGPAPNPSLCSYSFIYSSPPNGKRDKGMGRCMTLQYERRRCQSCRSQASTPVPPGDQKRGGTNRKRPRPGESGDEGPVGGTAVEWEFRPSSARREAAPKNGSLSPVRTQRRRCRPFVR